MLLGDRLIGTKIGEIDPAWKVRYLSRVVEYNLETYNREPVSLYFSSTGLDMLTLNRYDKSVAKYFLPAAWSPSSTLMVQDKITLSEISGSVNFIAVNATASLLFVLDYSNRRIHRYNNNVYETYFQLPSSFTYGTETISIATGPGAESYRGLYYSDADSTLHVTVKGTDGKCYLLKLNDVDSGTSLSLESAKYTGEYFSNLFLAGYRNGFFSLDGTKFYLENPHTYPATVVENILSIPWDVESSTSRITGLLPSVTGIVGFFIGNEGQNILSVSATYTQVHKQSLTEAWNIATVGSSTSYDIYEFKASNITTGYVRESNENYYVVNMGSSATKNEVYHWSNDTQLPYLNRNDWTLSSYPTAIWFSQDGTKMYILGGSRALSQFTLSEAWNISTGTLQYTVFLTSDFTSSEITRGMWMDESGTMLYILASSGKIKDYLLSTAWDITTRSVVQTVTLTDNTEFGAATALSISPAGDKLLLARFDDCMLEYKFNLAFNFSTLSFVRYKVINVFGDPLSGIYVNSDGLNMRTFSGGKYETRFSFTL